jgi:hypothetical protein
MNLHKCILHPGIRTSDRFGRLSWFHRDLFYGLLNATHKGGWFEANAGTLRAALYAPCLGKVPERDIQDGLLKLREVGLIKLWTGKNGRAYGAILNHRQKFDYGEQLPPGAEAPDDALALDFTAATGSEDPDPPPDPEPPPEGNELNRIESNAAQPRGFSEEFTAAWERYVAHRRAMKMKPLQPPSIAAQFRRFEKWGEAATLAAIEETISNGWQGIFPPKAGAARRATAPVLEEYNRF